MKRLGISSTPIEGETEYLNKWSLLSGHVDCNSYRLFSTFCGHTPNIVPENIGRSFIEKVLNPSLYTYYYSDKNMYDKYISKIGLPKTYLRRINGGNILNESYCVVDMETLRDINMTYVGGDKTDGICNELILKPSVDSDSGRGVIKFVNKNGIYKSVNGEVNLSLQYLMRYGTDFVLQEAVQQHDDLSQFCFTSVNTIRVATYRSVKTEEVSVTATIMRIGKLGQCVDNAHAGGCFIGINPRNGKLNNYVCDQFGNKQKEWNGICFDKQEYFIPCWDKILEFAKYIGQQNPHCRLLALDLTLDKNGIPKLIEYNVNSFSYWLFMFSGQLPFGEFTDEIIEYCKIHTPSKIRLIC